MATFLGRPVSHEQLDKVTEHLRFDNFAKNDSVNWEDGKAKGMLEKEGAFIRKGNFSEHGNVAISIYH